MEVAQRQVAIVSSMGKRYSGMVDIPNPGFRTTDLLNSANIFWRNPNEKCYNNAILMHDVKVYIDDSTVFKKFEKLQIKLSEIIYFYDEQESIGDEREKKWASSMVQSTQEKAKNVQIVTRSFANSFYFMTGRFYGLFKKKSNDQFIALSQARIIEILKAADKWTKKEIRLPHQFLGVSNQHIEAVTFDAT